MVAVARLCAVSRFTPRYCEVRLLLLEKVCQCVMLPIITADFESSAASNVRRRRSIVEIKANRSYFYSMREASAHNVKRQQRRFHEHHSEGIFDGEF